MPEARQYRADIKRHGNTKPSIASDWIREKITDADVYDLVDIVANDTE